MCIYRNVCVACVVIAGVPNISTVAPPCNRKVSVISNVNKN